jgi:FixJ family two-component response regulator
MNAPRPTDGAQALVHVIDDDPSMRTALARLLSAAGYRVCTHADAGAFLIAAGDDPGGCLLLDLHMPGPDGLELHEALRRRGTELPTVFLTGRGDIAASVRALKAGASDFLTKPVDADRLLAAIGAAIAADAPRRAERERRRVVATRFASLDARERAVLRRVLQGGLTKQIADALQVSERTVKSCRAAMMHKMAAGSLQELVRLAADLPEGDDA